MQSVIKLIERVNDAKLPLNERYPELLDEGRINILFVSPFFNKHGLYRMILPAMELKETGRFSCIVTNTLQEDHTKVIDDFHVKMIPDLIRWADYIVFQANGENMDKFILNIKSVNPKVKIVLDIDRNYHALNTNNYATKKYTISRLRNLEKNLTLVDFSLYPDWVTKDFYEKKVGVDINTVIVPNLLSPFQFEGISAIQEVPTKDKKLRVLLMADQDDFDDINSFRDTINQVQVRVPEAKIHVLGNSISFDNKNPLRRVIYAGVKYRDMGEYYSLIKRMNPHVAIIPLKKQQFFRNYYKVLELGAFGIPVVTMNEYPYNHIFKKDLHLLLAGQKKSFVEGVRTLVDDTELHTGISQRIKSFVEGKYTWNNPAMAQAWIDAFSK